MAERTIVTEVREHYAMLVEANLGTRSWAEANFNAALAEVWDEAVAHGDPGPNPYRSDRG